MGGPRRPRKRKPVGESYWNYRVIEREIGDGLTELYIHEVHYDARGRITGWTERECRPLGSTMAELRADLAYFRRALRDPVLRARQLEAMLERRRSRTGTTPRRRSANLKLVRGRLASDARPKPP